MKRLMAFWFAAVALLTASCQFFTVTDQGIIGTPLDQQSVAGTISILITEPDGVSADQVFIYVDDAQLPNGYLTTAPWQADWDTADGSYTNGPHSIYAELYGTMGEFYSNTITVYVANQ